MNSKIFYTSAEVGKTKLYKMYQLSISGIVKVNKVSKGSENISEVILNFIYSQQTRIDS